MLGKYPPGYSAGPDGISRETYPPKVPPKHKAQTQMGASAEMLDKNCQAQTRLRRAFRAKATPPKTTKPPASPPALAQTPRLARRKVHPIRVLPRRARKKISAVATGISITFPKRRAGSSATQSAVAQGASPAILKKSGRLKRGFAKYFARKQRRLRDLGHSSPPAPARPPRLSRRNTQPIRVAPAECWKKVRPGENRAPMVFSEKHTRLRVLRDTQRSHIGGMPRNAAKQSVRLKRGLAQHSATKRRRPRRLGRPGRPQRPPCHPGFPVATHSPLGSLARNAGQESLKRAPRNIPDPDSSAPESTATHGGPSRNDGENPSGPKGD